MNKNLLIPNSKELSQKASLIISTHGLEPLQPKHFNYDTTKADKEAAAYEKGSTTDNFDGIGMLGLPVFDTVVLESPSYTNDSGGTVEKKTFVLDIALIEVSNERHIITTDIAGRNGSIKEYMSNGDSKISIKGMLVNDAATIAPVQQIKDLNTVASCPDTLKVVSNFLSYLGIVNLVITQVKFSQQEATRNTVGYELECISDIPFEIKNA